MSPLELLLRVQSRDSTGQLFVVTFDGRQIRIGLNSTIPDRAIAMPPCNQKDPMAIPADAQPYLKVPPATGLVSVELTYQDGSVSEVKTFRR